MAFDDVRLVEAAQDRARHLRGVLRLPQVRGHHHELVAAGARDRVLFAHAAHEPRRHLLEQRIADVVAERIVDGLEAVDVDEHRGEEPVLAALAGDGVRQPVLQQRAVRQPRQRIARGELLDARLVALALGDVGAGAAVGDHGARLVVRRLAAHPLPAYLAGFGHGHVLEIGERPARHRVRGDPARHALVLARRHEVAGPPPEQRLDRASQHGLGAPGQVSEAPLAVGFPHVLAGSLDHVAEALLAFADLDFGALALGDVGVGPDHAQRVAARRALRDLAVAQDPLPLPVARAHAVLGLVFRNVPLEGGREVGVQRVALVGMGELEHLRQRRADGAGRLAEHRGPLLGQVEIAAVDRAVPQRQARALERQGEAFLGFAQLVLGALMIADLGLQRRVGAGKLVHPGVDGGPRARHAGSGVGSDGLPLGSAVLRRVGRRRVEHERMACGVAAGAHRSRHRDGGRARREVDGECLVLRTTTSGRHNAAGHQPLQESHQDASSCSAGFVPGAARSTPIAKTAVFSVPARPGAPRTLHGRTPSPTGRT